VILSEKDQWGFKLFDVSLQDKYSSQQSSDSVETVVISFDHKEATASCTVVLTALFWLYGYNMNSWSIIPPFPMALPAL